MCWFSVWDDEIMIMSDSYLDPKDVIFMRRVNNEEYEKYF